MQSNDQLLAPLGQLDSGMEQLLNQLNEPAWLTDDRRALWRAYGEVGNPDWRRTDLRGLSLDLLRPAYGSAEITFPGQEGVIVRELDAALRERPDLLDGVLGSALLARPNKFTALHGALWRDGVFVYVPRNVEVTEPIRVTYRISDPGTAIFPRTVVVAEQGAAVTVVEEFVSDDLSDPALCIPAAEIVVGENAEVRFISAQNFGRNAYHIGSQLVDVRRDGRLFWLCAAIGAKTQHLNMEVRLTGNGAHADWLGVNYANEQQNLLFGPIIRHIGLHTEGQVNFRNVVDDQGYAVFDGLIKIEKGAQGTNSDLRDNALHLSAQSRTDSIPGLEIDANDVKAGHGSTSGPVDEEQVFYLMARGLPRPEALRAIVMGFVTEIVEQVPVEDLRERLIERIEAKIA